MAEQPDLTEAVLTVATLANRLASRVAGCEGALCVVAGAFARLAHSASPTALADVSAFLQQPMESFVAPTASNTTRDGAAEMVQALRREIGALG